VYDGDVRIASGVFLTSADCRAGQDFFCLSIDAIRVIDNGEAGRRYGIIWDAADALFTTAQLAGMRDRTRRRNYSAEAEEFRRDLNGIGNGDCSSGRPAS